MSDMEVVLWWFCVINIISFVIYLFRQVVKWNRDIKTIVNPSGYPKGHATDCWCKECEDAWFREISA